MDRLFLECTLRAALLVLGTAAVLYFMRIRSAAVKHIFWTTVMVLMLALPIWTMWGPIVSLPILPVQPETNASYAIGHANILSASSLPSLAVPIWKLFVLGTYLLGFCLFAARLAISTVGARRLVQRASTSDGIHATPLCAVPVTIGFFRPVVVFPEGWRQWSRSQFDAISAHEGEHVRRRDGLVQWMALLNRSLFWFHPAAWWLERKLGALAEEACDDAVLSHGHNPKEYAECLINMARSVARSGFRVNVAGMAMPGEFLSQRVRKILEVGRSPSVSRGRMACVVGVCLMMCSAFTMGKLSSSRQASVSQHEAPPSASAGTKFVLGDLKIEGDVHDRDSVRNRILDAWRGRQFDSVAQLVKVVVTGLREHFQDRGYFKGNGHVLAVRRIGKVSGNQAERVSVSVNEGPQYRVGKIDVLALDPSVKIPPPETVRTMFPMNSGDILDASKLRTGLAKLHKWYSSRGHADIKAAPRFTIDDTHRIIDVAIVVPFAPPKTEVAASSDCNASVDVKNSSIENGYEAHVIIRAKVNSARPGAWVTVGVTPSYTYTTSDGTQRHDKGSLVLIKILSSATSEGEAVLQHPLDGCSFSKPCHLNNVSAKAHTSCSDQ